MITYPWATRCPIFSQIQATFLLCRRRRHDQEEKGSTRGGICAQLSKICSLKKYSIVFCHVFYLGRCQKSQKNLPWRTFVSKVFFPADVLPRKCQLIFLGRIFVSKVFFSCRRPSEICLIIFSEGPRQVMHIFPADVLLGRSLQKFDEF